MASNSLFGKVRDNYANNGAIRTIGATAGYAGREIEDRCDRIEKIREEDRGKGYPLRCRIRAARHGLSAYRYLVLGLEDDDVDRYITSGDPIEKLNRGYITPVHDKYTFQLLTKPYVESLPAMYGLLDEGTFTKRLEARREEDVFAILERDRSLVLKPVRGGGGVGIFVLHRRGDAEFVVNGRPTSEAEIEDLIRGLHEYIVSEFVDQHQYSNSIFPDATNTLRIFSVIDPDSRTPRVFRSAHRFGSVESAPTDNFSRGGYCTPVDIQAGMIKRLIHLDNTTRTTLDSHPETGNRVRGVNVPYWDEVRELVLEAADLHRQARIVGWDVVISEDGPVLLEANARPGPTLLQLERGVLEDQSVRRLLGYGSNLS